MALVVRACVLLVAALLPVAANSIRDLIALPDGHTVFFGAKTGIATETSWRLDSWPDGVIAMQRAFSPLVDTDASGAVQAVFSHTTEKVCGSSGSTCSLAPNCRASFGIWTAGVWQYKSDFRQTLVRLNQRGTVAWIEQKTSCLGTGVPNMPLLRGFYDAATLKPLSGAMIPSPDVQLANSRTGRPTIVDSLGADDSERAPARVALH